MVVGLDNVATDTSKNHFHYFIITILYENCTFYFATLLDYIVYVYIETLVCLYIATGFQYSNYIYATE